MFWHVPSHLVFLLPTAFFFFLRRRLGPVQERLEYLARGDGRMRRDVADSMAARDWLIGEQAAGRLKSVIGPIATLITVKDPVRRYFDAPL